MTKRVPLACRPVWLVTAAFALVACVTNGGVTNCSVEGAKYLSADATEASICELFERRLRDSLAETGFSMDENLSVTLRLHKRGAIEARIATADGHKTYPSVEVEVTDRPLGEKDIGQLANTVAKLLLDA